MPKRTPNDDQNALLERLRRHIEILRLTHIGAHLDEYLAWAIKEAPSSSALLERILGEEARLRSEKRIERRIAKSGLPVRKTLETFDFAFQPKLDPAVIRELALLDFIRRAEDLIISGKSGTGKSHILQALALLACAHQFSVRYARAVDLLNDLYAGLADGTYLTRLKRWTAPQFLVIDDVGLGQVKHRDNEPTAAHMLYDLLDRRHSRVSTAMTSNIKLGAWGQYLGDATLAAAVLDRIVMRAIRIDIEGPSYRQHTARERAKLKGTTPPDDEPQA
ncbi:MAG: ATP-binding protein [Deltaproteobacteria bacterium]|nr:ATP-binding protein [Deltaproteobacteria bacterium]